MKKNLVLILFILMIPCLIQSQTLNIIPQPSSAEVKQGILQSRLTQKLFYQRRC
jgi:hypothetical protein